MRVNKKLEGKAKKQCPFFYEYYKLVKNKKVKVCKENTQLFDLIFEKIDKQKIKTDVKKCNAIFEMIEKFRPYKLTPVQKFLHSMIYTYNTDGTLVWNEFLLLCGRGFGKNSFISDFTFGATSNKNGIKKYNVDMVATSEDQAMTSFLDIYEMIDENPVLNKAFYRTKEQIKFVSTNSKIKYYTSNAKTKDGLRPGAVVFDEIHAYETYENIKVFSSALGKVQDGRIIYATTNGNFRGGVLDDFIAYGKLILDELDVEAKLFPYICKIDSYEEWQDPTLWEKANPMLPWLPLLRNQYEADFEKSKIFPEMKIEFMLKRLNYVIEDVTKAVATWEDILATNQEVDWNDFNGCECIGGVDFASVRDFIGVGLLFKKDGKVYFKHHTFIVSKSLQLTKFKIPLDVAKANGLITIIDGDVMDEELIANWFINQVAEHGYRIKDIAADDYRRAVLNRAFNDLSLPIKSVRSGSITHGKLAPLVEKLFIERKLVFGADMMMRWYTNNVKVVTDSKGNKTYHKIEPIKRKTDGFMAFIHALSLVDNITEKKIAYTPTLKTYTY